MGSRNGREAVAEERRRGGPVWAWRQAGVGAWERLLAIFVYVTSITYPLPYRFIGLGWGSCHQTAVACNQASTGWQLLSPLAH